jgi:hypothetical protein
MLFTMKERGGERESNRKGKRERVAERGERIR